MKMKRGRRVERVGVGWGYLNEARRQTTVPGFLNEVLCGTVHVLLWMELTKTQINSDVFPSPMYKSFNLAKQTVQFTVGLLIHFNLTLPEGNDIVLQ